MIQTLKYQFLLLQSIRNFFLEKGFLDVMTPPMVENPGMEVHIHPFGVYQANSGKKTNYYLHTSPEFAMKYLLAEGFEKIFTLSYCFRDEPDSEHHRKQFIMLEWYRAKERYEKIMEDTVQLIDYSLHFLKNKNVKIKDEILTQKMEKYTIQELFLEYLKVDILEFLDKEELRKLIEKNFKDIPLPNVSTKMEWDDYYFLLFLNKIEGKLKKRPKILLYEFPHYLKALSTLKESDARVAERFEVYLNGIEICNCFNELTNYDEQKTRFAEQGKLKEDLYGYQLPDAKPLWKAFDKGLPTASGIALGVERLLLSLIHEKDVFFDLDK